MIKVSLVDGKGTGNKPTVTEDGGLLVSNITCPPLIKSRCKIFSQKFTIEGEPDGDPDMGIDGSATPVEFHVDSAGDKDIYITSIGFILGYGASAEMFEFADSGAALVNGVEVSYLDSKGIKTVIANLKANYSFHRFSLLGVSSTNWESKGFAVSGDYGYFVTISLANMCPPHGVKLEANSTQRLSVLIRDDCTSADLFECEALGFERVW